MATQGCSPIQVGPPAARLRHLQEKWGSDQAKAAVEQRDLQHLSPAPRTPGGRPGPPSPCAVLPPGSVLHRGLATTPLGSAIQKEAKPEGWGIGAPVPPPLPPEATARCRRAQCRRPGPGSPSGRGTPGRALGAGSGVRIRGSCGSRSAPSLLPPCSWSPRRSLRPAPTRSPRVSSGAASTSSCEESASAGVRTLSPRPPSSPHLARPPPVQSPESAFPRLQLQPHVLQPFHGARPSDRLGARAP